MYVASKECYCSSAIRSSNTQLDCTSCAQGLATLQAGLAATALFFRRRGVLALPTIEPASHAGCDASALSGVARPASSPLLRVCGRVSRCEAA